MGAEKAIRNLIPVYEARGIIYIKRGAMGFLVSNAGDAAGKVALTPQEKESVNRTVNDMYGLQAGKSTIGVTEQPVSFVKTSMSISEMQPFDETLADAVAIYSCLRVPRHLVPSKDNSTFANADADMKSFYSDVILPWGKRYAEHWTNYMGLKNFRRYIKADYSHVDVLQENRKEKSDVDRTEGTTYRERFVSGLWTLNQWLFAIGENKNTNPIYDKTIFDLEEEEYAQVQERFGLKPIAQPMATNPENEAGKTPVIPFKKVVNE